jgi:uncharacterized protein YwgA
MIEKFRWLAAVIAAHSNHRVVGRTRLQKTIKLLQRLGFPTDYGYTIFFYGPYSEGLYADIGLLKHFGLIEEEERKGQDGSTYYVISATEESALPHETGRFQPWIDKLQASDATVLELAATYDAFREMGSQHNDAMVRLRRKKGTKCDGGNQEAAFRLLRELGLPTT